MLLHQLLNLIFLLFPSPEDITDFWILENNWLHSKRGAQMQDPICQLCATRNLGGTPLCSSPLHLSSWWLFEFLKIAIANNQQIFSPWSLCSPPGQRMLRCTTKAEGRQAWFSLHIPPVPLLSPHAAGQTLGVGIPGMPASAGQYWPLPEPWACPSHEPAPLSPPEVWAAKHPS